MTSVAKNQTNATSLLKLHHFLSLSQQDYLKAVSTDTPTTPYLMLKGLFKSVSICFSEQPYVLPVIIF